MSAPACTTCRLCGGTGQRPLTDVETSTLAVLTEEWQDTSAIVETLERGGLHITYTGVCNRLMRMIPLGLCERRRCPGGASSFQWRIT